MYERILVPLDGSDLAEVALPYAEELAGRLGSEINLLYISEPGRDQYRHMSQLYIQKMVETIEHSAGKYLKRPGGREIKVESAILVGNPAEEIIDYAEKENIGLIIMATHGRSGIKRWPLGSVADKVVRATKRPLVVVRANGARPDMREKGILNRALVPLDGSKEGETVVPYIEEFASKLKMEVILLQVLATGYHYISAEGFGYAVHPAKQLESDMAFAQAYLDAMVTQLKRKGVSAKPEVRAGAVAEEIINFADEIHADVVAMSTHGRSGVGRWALGSIAERVVREGNTPVLLVRASGASTEQHS